MLIDDYLPSFQFRESHQRTITASPMEVLNAVTTLETADDRWVNTFIWLRELPGRLLSNQNASTNSEKTPFGLQNFTVLERNGDLEIVFGLVGRFWQLNFGLIPIADAEEFKKFNEKNIPKLVFNFSTVCQENNQTLLRTETRVFCNTRSCYWRFFPYWYLIRPISGLIRQRMLKQIERTVTTYVRNE